MRYFVESLSLTFPFSARDLRLRAPRRRSDSSARQACAELLCVLPSGAAITYKMWSFGVVRALCGRPVPFKGPIVFAVRPVWVPGPSMVTRRFAATRRKSRGVRRWSAPLDTRLSYLILSGLILSVCLATNRSFFNTRRCPI